MKIVFTEHAKERIKKRGISEDEVINVIKYAEQVDKRHEKYYARKNIRRGKIEVVYKKENYLR